VPDGYHLRDLPDGCLEFVLEDPVLGAVVVTGEVTLRFGTVDVVLAAPFGLAIDGVAHLVDPGRPVTLGPLLTLIPGSARWLVASRDGQFTLEFMQGQRLVVPGPAVHHAWTVTTATPGAG
jgi:Family of unknown function (DUF6188)